MARADELRLMTRVARLYYEVGLKQQEIAGRLRLTPAGEKVYVIASQVMERHLGLLEDLEQLKPRAGCIDERRTNTVSIKCRHCSSSRLSQTA